MYIVQYVHHGVQKDLITMNRRPPPLDLGPETFPWYQVEERSNLPFHVHLIFDYRWSAPGEHIELVPCIIDTDLAEAAGSL